MYFITSLSLSVTNSFDLGAKMAWYGVFVVLIISVCFTANIKAQELVIASSGPDSCAGMGSGYIAFYRCMLKCFQDDLGYDGFVESDFCSGNVQVAIFQGDGADTYTIDDLKEALQCVTGRCRSVIPPSVCQDSTPQIINLPDDMQKEVLSGIESGKYKNFSRSESERKRGSSGLKSEHLVDNSGSQGQLDASGLLSEVLKATGIQPGQTVFIPGSPPGQTVFIPGSPPGQTVFIPGSPPGQTVFIPGSPPGQLVVSGQPEQSDGSGTQTSRLDASGLLSEVLKATGQSGDIFGLQPGQSVGVPGLQPGQPGVVPGQQGQLIVSGQPGQSDDLGTQTSQLDASRLLSKVLKATGLQQGQSENIPGSQPGQSAVVTVQPGQLVVSGQPGQMDGFDTQTSQLDASGLLSKVLKASGIQPGQPDVSGMQTAKLNALRLQPGQAVAVSGPSSEILASGSGPQSGSLALASAPGDSIDDCDYSQDDTSSNSPTSDSNSTPTTSASTSSTISGTTPASSSSGTTSDSSTSGTTTATTVSEASGSSSAGSSTASETVSTLSTDSTSDASADDCEEYDGSLSNFDEDSNSFSANGNNFESAVASASVNGDTIDSSDDYDYQVVNCTYFYDDYNGTFSNCSFFNESYSNSSDYDYENSSSFSNYDSANAFAEAQVINQDSGIQQFQSNNGDASSVIVGNSQNQGQFANAAVFNQNPTIQQYQFTDQNIGVAPSANNQAQGQFINIPLPNQGPTLQQIQNNNGFRDLNSQNLGQFGSAPVVAQSLNQGQLQSQFPQIQGSGSQIPAVQQYQSSNNDAGIAIGSGQNTNQFVNSFLQGQGFNQNPSVIQYGNGFSANQQNTAQIVGTGNGGSGPTQGLSPNIQQTQAAVGNFGSLPQFNSGQNNANIQQFSVGGNNPAGSASNAGFGIGSSGQTQGFALNFPSQGQNNFGNIPQFNSAPNSGNFQQFNGGGSNQASAVANSAAGIGSSSQTLGGVNSNGPAGSGFGTGPSQIFQFNSGNVPSYNGGQVNSAAAGSGASSQVQSSSLNVPGQASAFSGSNFGGGSNFNGFQYNGNAPQTNGGGIGQNSNGAAVSSFASSGGSAGIPANSQSFGGNAPFRQASAFGSAANAQASVG